MNSKGKNILHKLHRFFTQRIVYHILIWIAYLLLFSIFQSVSGSGSYWFYFSNELIKIAFYASGVYFNILYLIPNYLSNKKFLIYCALLLLTTIILTPLQVFFLFIKAENFPEYQTTLVESQLWLFILTFLVVSVSTIFKIVSDWVRHQRERKELQTESMQSELRFLRSQINPHFLFNTLNNLYGLSVLKSDKLPSLMLKLSDLLRYSLYETSSVLVPLEKEIQYLENYISLEKIRLEDKTDITFEVSGSVSSIKIAPMLLIVFVENAFKHLGVLSDEKSSVSVKIIEDNDELFFRCENSIDGSEIENHELEKGKSGIGLANVKKRLALLYLDKHQLKIEKTNTLYSINLKLF